MRVPNKVELARKPDPVRYTWIVKTDKDIYYGATWGHLQTVYENVPEDTEYTLLIIDTVEAQCYQVEDFEAFMTEWRQNYFNPEWKY